MAESPFPGPRLIRDPLTSERRGQAQAPSEVGPPEAKREEGKGGEAEEGTTAVEVVAAGTCGMRLANSEVVGGAEVAAAAGVGAVMG